VKEKLSQCIVDSTKKYNCDYTNSIVIDKIFNAFEIFEGDQEKWLQVFMATVRKVYKNSGRKDYKDRLDHKDIRRVVLPIGTSGKGMAMFYRVNGKRRLIDNFKAIDINFS